jgi:uncharacterized protein YeaO (DUF488 family)
MKTSYFTKAAKYPNTIAISQGVPKNYFGKRYMKLAPPWELIMKYKQDNDWNYFREHYYKEILDKLDPQEVWNELGEYCVLLCWENPNKHCHRFIIAEWFKNKLGKEVNEL